MIDMKFKSEQAAEQTEDMKNPLLSDYLRDRIEKAKLMLEQANYPENVSMLNFFSSFIFRRLK